MNTQDEWFLKQVLSYVNGKMSIYRIKQMKLHGINLSHFDELKGHDVSIQDIKWFYELQEWIQSIAK